MSNNISNYGLIISKPGYDANTETDFKNLIFHSDLNHLKTAGSGSFIREVSSSSSIEKTIPHGLKTKPLAIAYFRDISSDRWFISMSQPESSNTRYYTNINVELSVDDYAIYFTLNNRDGSKTKNIEVKYEYFYEGEL